MEGADRSHARMTGLLAVSSEPGAIPVDSLVFLARSLLIPAQFSALTAAYRSAMATGGLTNLRAPELVEALMRFDDAHERYSFLSNIDVESWFLGVGFEMRRRLGSITALAGPTAENGVPDRFRLSPDEYRDFIQSPDFYAQVEVTAVRVRSQRGELLAMEQATRMVLDRLARH